MTWARTILVLDLPSILTILMKEKLDPIKDLFPYDAFRPSQDRFIKECHESLDKPRHVVISAPNGFGKTVSTLCAAIPVALENDLKIVYCCRTHTQNSRVIMELNKIFQKLDKEGKDIKSLYHLGGVSLRSRTDMCFMDQVLKANLNPSDASIVCGQLRADNRCKFFRNMKWALGKDDLHLPVSTNSSFDAGDIKDYCSMKNYCPYFYSRELQKKVLVIVANYNWVFDPDIQERFLDVINVPLEEILLIIDEAHNLPPLAERIYSRKLGDYTISAATRELGEYFHRDSDKDELKSFLRLIQDLFDEYEDRIGNQDEMDLDGRKIIQDLQHGLNQDLGILFHHLDETGKEIQKEKLASGKRNPRSFCRAVAKFWREWYLYTLDKASYYHCFSLNRDSATLRHNFEAVCLDPGLTGIQHVMERVFASVSLSGTIIPNVYSTQCRINQPVTIELPSPFKENHVKAFILDGVSTAFKDRDESM
ncbi:hypothetical protein GF325_03055, partial [Candidatus Bathyarchaeota archaeon]|nr:hypothetical protein [Candidatus Bathyarchaeota archaeon]